MGEGRDGRWSLGTIVRYPVVVLASPKRSGLVALQPVSRSSLVL